MYKKITHNIIEEHFDHPLATQIKKSITKSRFPEDQIFNFDTSEFRMQVNFNMNEYSAKLNQILDGVTTPESDIIPAFASIFTNIDKMGDLSKSFFPIEFSERLVQSLRAWAIYSLMMVHKAKVGQDYSIYKEAITTTATELIDNFRDFDSAMPVLDFSPAITNIASNIKDKVDAKVANNTNLIVSSSADLVTNCRIFANAYSNGIISKFPNRFMTVPTV